VVEKYYGDSSLANAYREGRDIHRYNASKIFNRAEEEIADAERRFAKTISFSLLYGSSEKSVAESTGRTKDEVHELFEAFFRAFPGVKAYIEATHRFVSTYGCVRTPFGRVKHIPAALNRDDRGEYSTALRQAQNSIIQSSGSDLSVRSISYMHDYFKSHNMLSRVIAFIHDSIELDVYPNEWFECYDLLLYAMKTYNELLDFIVCPLGIDVELGTSMGDSVAVKKMIVNEDGSRVFKLKGHDYIMNDLMDEAKFEYEILKNEILEENEIVDNPGDLVARKAINLSFDNQKFLEQVREVILVPKKPKLLIA
jgi:DNA polymerase I-like protein with 3'-5' exonuclease and polymerase domains